MKFQLIAQYIDKTVIPYMLVNEPMALQVDEVKPGDVILWPDEQHRITPFIVNVVWESGMVQSGVECSAEYQLAVNHHVTIDRSALRRIKETREARLSSWSRAAVVDYMVRG